MGIHYPLCRQSKKTWNPKNLSSSLKGLDAQIFEAETCTVLHFLLHENSYSTLEPAYNNPMHAKSRPYCDSKIWCMSWWAPCKCDHRVQNMACNAQSTGMPIRSMGLRRPIHTILSSTRIACNQITLSDASFPRRKPQITVTSREKIKKLQNPSISFPLPRFKQNKKKNPILT